MTNEPPLIDVVQHAPRYMVRCSRCGVVAVNLSLSEVEKERESHQCSPHRQHRA